jgi:hypothetical protein
VIAADKVLEKEPQNVEALLARANAFGYWRKDPDARSRTRARVLELDPDSIDAMKPRILALLALERTEEARTAIAELGRRIEEIGRARGHALVVLRDARRSSPRRAATSRARASSGRDA